MKQALSQYYSTILLLKGFSASSRALRVIRD